jgi:hypothetical protein
MQEVYGLQWLDHSTNLGVYANLESYANQCRNYGQPQQKADCDLKNVNPCCEYLGEGVKFR